MSRTFTSHRPKPARVTRTGAAPGQSALTAPPAPIPRAAPTGKAPGKPTGKPTGEPPTGRPKEIGGPSGPEPTRYGDWERNGICVDF
jgi:homeobox protein ESX1